MATSKDNEDSEISELLGIVMTDTLQEQLLDGADSMPQTAVSNAQGTTSNIDTLIFSSASNDSSMSSQLTPVAEGVVEAFQDLEDRLYHICSSANTPRESNSNPFGADANNVQTHAEAVTLNTDNHEGLNSRLGQHIMISYHHDSSYQICEELFRRLRNRGYKVWMDRNDLHGSIHQGMADAIENAFVVLFLMNHDYYESEFCQKEVLYTDKKRINFVPCLLQAGYEPSGYLGLVIRDRLYIDFTAPGNFDASFEELMAEIHTIEKQTQASPTSSMKTFQTTCSRPLSTDIFTDGLISHESLRTVIREFKESINQIYNDAQPITEEEFPQFVDYIRQHVFPNELQSSSTGHNNSQQILREILLHSRTQTEYLRRITEILSNLTETRTVIKLSLAVVLLYTINKFFQHG
ncbi:unnamed protein product [Adineta ricciae]|uniref:TIR domain-containing protein n=1 Tax=Adineta ricciae TaxID=249248 RepID=A0A815KP26_ADIRI|nr:unnamed protein product [Adineta ricciae]CAF1398345.1 unnamed protein product [Adineta ricciae]